MCLFNALLSIFHSVLSNLSANKQTPKQGDLNLSGFEVLSHAFFPPVRAE